MFTAVDHEMMARAISLAGQGRFTTHPNPNVGCVITRNAKIVGEGFHYRAGEPHAEVHALRMAGEKAQGSTVYVTLEPCSHYGRTPPCAEGLIRAGVARVICAMQDPNPMVAGRGIAMLKEAGIEVEVGLLELSSRALNQAFLARMESGRPWVQVKMAASVDGQTALANGKSQWITSAEARQDVQKFRAQAGAILSTSQTVMADNASLNVRWDDLPISVQQSYPKEQLRQPTRVILDRQHRLTREQSLFQKRGSVLTVAEQDADILVPSDSDGLDLTQFIGTLSSEFNINHLWVEAGATLAGSLVRSKLVDELVIYLAPKLMGCDGRGLFDKLELDDMNDAIELSFKDVRMVGDDLRIIAQPCFEED